MSEMTRQEILLESGTNEMEIIEFYLGTQPFGINVQKLREIIPYDPNAVTRLPDVHESMLGTLLLRGRTLPLIDIRKHVEARPGEEDADTRRVVLVCEFNELTNGFLVDGVNQIHRVSWEQVQPMSVFLDQYKPRFTGSIQIDNREILILDLEHVVAEIDPEAGTAYDDVQGASAVATPETRREKLLMLAEDSAIIRCGIQRVLKASGYEQLQVFDNGKDCCDAVKALKEKHGSDLQEVLHLVISDIEMPKMDGLTLCRQIKEAMGLKNLRVIMFSSLINEQMALKCDQVGADGYVTKPQIPELVEMVDRLVFGSEGG
ncbi:chemotaxis protein CheV [Geothermobacter hydrogeniphilus]|uniref:Chemotaxis protein CheV n=1 Tax=Geothermobacter hydrogeniphilus TaxID=1969733 RepID=A0A2K2HAE0_9BACT|nr:chemotaxis protein [Geothermobacter hydrogeniphilus]PNU20237.1 chemotaxis protein CheV [Geothermobacter hydrogeniphilus]